MQPPTFSAHHLGLRGVTVEGSVEVETRPMLRLEPPPADLLVRTPLLMVAHRQLV